MKKIYIRPEIMVCSMDNNDLIATSDNVVTYGGSNSDGPKSAEGNERGNAIWDD